jgi:hypothetical protein
VSEGEPACEPASAELQFAGTTHVTTAGSVDDAPAEAPLLHRFPWAVPVKIALTKR